MVQRLNSNEEVVYFLQNWIEDELIYALRRNHWQP